ncbi:MAG: DUF4396 domain-containing protein [Nostocoides sp.]
MPTWLTAVSVLSVAAGLVCAAWIALDVRRRPQPMRIMALVWPISALYAGPVLLWFYRRHGRSPAADASSDAELSSMDGSDIAMSGASMMTMPAHSHRVGVATDALHCGAGCTLGDINAETAAYLAPGTLAVFGYPGLFNEPMFATWVLDFILAFGFGIAFQYFAIAPMRGLGLRDGLIAALKADALSLTAWQIGMYGLMAIAMFGLFRPLLGQMPQASSPVFWFVMQVSMMAGFVTAYPMNAWLILRGIKDSM